MQVIDRPKYGDILEIHTWISNVSKLYTYRDFEVYVNGVKKIIASSKWLLININTLRPAKIPEDLIAKYQPEYNKSVFGITEIPKCKEQNEYEKEIDYPIRKSDIDINNHVHNLNYIDMAYEIIDTEEQFRNVRISYKKEIRIEDRIKIGYHKENEKKCFRIMNYEKNMVNALIEMEQ